MNVKHSHPFLLFPRALFPFPTVHPCHVGGAMLDSASFAHQTIPSWSPLLPAPPPAAIALLLSFPCSLPRSCPSELGAPAFPCVHIGEFFCFHHPTPAALFLFAFFAIMLFLYLFVQLFCLPLPSRSALHGNMQRGAAGSCIPHTLPAPAPDFPAQHFSAQMFIVAWAKPFTVTSTAK